MALSPERVAAQEVALTGPLVCAHAAVCLPPRRHGLLAVSSGALLSLDDPTRTTVLGTATLRYFTSERLGFGVFAAHHLADVEPDGARAAAERSVEYAARARPQWGVAPEAALAIGVGRLSYDVPFDWLVSAGPIVAATKGAETRTKLGATVGSALTLLFMPTHLSVALDWRWIGVGPANAYVGLSVGIGMRAKYGGNAPCRDLDAEARCDP